MLLSFKNVNIAFSGNTIIKDISVDVALGDKLVFKGSSGSGKTSLLNVLIGFVKPKKGEVFFKGNLLSGANIGELRKLCAYLPQQLVFSNYSVKSFLELPFTFEQNKSNSPTEKKILDYFSMFDLKSELLANNMQDVSGGEKQRIALVSCLLLQREILLLDEPTSALDKGSKGKVMDFLFNIPRLTIISSSHDPDWIARCGKIVNL